MKSCIRDTSTAAWLQDSEASNSPFLLVPLPASVLSSCSKLIKHPMKSSQIKPQKSSKVVKKKKSLQYELLQT